MQPPVVIAHRGACGYLPEHTIAAYAVALAQGADFIELDVVPTRDGRLVCRHERELSATTDVATRPEFAARRRLVERDGEAVDDWLVDEFTLAELRTLRARERLPALRPCSARLDGGFEIATLEEALRLISWANGRLDRPDGRHRVGATEEVGVFVEIKDGLAFKEHGADPVPLLIDALERCGFNDDYSPVWIEAFEAEVLQRLHMLTPLPLVQLVDDSAAMIGTVPGEPAEQHVADRAGLLERARGYAAAVAAEKQMLIGRDPGASPPANAFIESAHQAGLLVFGWTFRAENLFLPEAYRRGRLPGAVGDLEGEITAHLAAGIDGFFTDHPDIGVRARDRAVR